MVVTSSSSDATARGVTGSAGVSSLKMSDKSDETAAVSFLMRSSLASSRRMVAEAPAGDAGIGMPRLGSAGATLTGSSTTTDPR